MWVSQTYLGVIEPDATVFVYYFYEDYDSSQTDFTEKVQYELENLGMVYDGKVSLFMPNPRYANDIESEIRQIRELWEIIDGELPGLFISTTPLKELDIVNSEYEFISFKSKNADDVAQVIQKIRKLADKTLAWKDPHPSQPEPDSLLSRFWRALELKPNVSGVGIDLKELVKKNK